MRVNDLLCKIDDLDEDVVHANTEVLILGPENVPMSISDVVIDLAPGAVPVVFIKVEFNG